MTTPELAHHPPVPLSSAPLPLWAFTLLGVVTGLFSAAIFEFNLFKDHSTWAAAALAFTWTATLGMALLDDTRRRLGALGLALLVGLGMLVLKSDGPSADIPLLLAGSGAVLLAAWIPGKREKPVWDAQQAPRFLVESGLVFVVAALLSGLFYALVNLAAALVEAVGFPGFQRVVQEPWVMFPLMVGAAAFFMGALRLQGWGQSLTRTLAHLLGFLLPVATLIALAFLPLLPVAGLKDTEKLFQGILSSPLYLTLTGVTLLLTLMAFYQRPTVLPARLQTFVRWGAFVLPVYPLLALYGLWKRVQEYGWTDARVLGFMLAGWLLVSAVAVALTRLRPAFEGLSQALLFSAAVLTGLSVLMLLPGLQPSQLAIRSQVGRVTQAEITVKQRAEALLYLQHRSGEAGKRALESLDTSHLDAETQQMVKHARTLSYWNFRERYVTGEALQAWTFTFKTMQDSLPIPEAQQQVLIGWAKEGTSDQNSNALCYVIGVRICQIRAFATATPRGQRILVPNNYDFNSGQWAEFAANGALLARGSYAPKPGDTPSTSGKNPFNSKASAVKVSLDALKLENGETILFAEQK